MTSMTHESNERPTVDAKATSSKKNYLFGLVMALWGCTLVLAVFLFQKAYGPLLFTPDPARTEYWGEVRQIQFPSSLARSTQIETDRKTFLVWGSWLVDKGMKLERRDGFWDPQVCIVGTEQCRKLASKP